MQPRLPIRWSFSREQKTRQQPTNTISSCQPHLVCQITCVGALVPGNQGGDVEFLKPSWREFMPTIPRSLVTFFLLKQNPGT